jgi:MFS family permease
LATTYNFQVILPLLARYTLQSGAVGFGTLDAAMGIGSLIGALGVAARLTPNRRSVLLAATGFSVLLALLAVSRLLITSIAILVGLGLVSVLYSSLTNTTLQLRAPEEFRGRILSLYLLLFQGTSPIGGAITGGLADVWSIEVAITVEAGICLVVVAVAFLALRRSHVVEAPLSG